MESVSVATVAQKNGTGLNDPARWAAIVESLAVPMLVIDQHGRVVVFNAAAAALYCLPPSAVLGQPMAQLLPEASRDLHAARLRTQPSYAGHLIETTLVVAGEEILVRVALARVDWGGGDYGFTAVIRDFRERATLLRRWQASEESYRQLFTTMQEGVAICEAETAEGEYPVELPGGYRFVAANPAFERLIRLSAAQLLGHSVQTILPEPERDWFLSAVRGPLGQRRVHYSPNLNRFLSVLAFAPRPRHRAVLVEDVTELQQAMDRAERLARAAQAADRLKSEIMANVSHELNTPLAVMLGATDVLQLHFGVDGEVRELLGIIQSSGEQLKKVIRNLMDAAAIEAGDQVVELALAPLEVVVYSAVEMARTRVEAAGQTLDLRLPDETVMAWADAQRVHQVVDILLDNATRFTPYGGRITAVLNAQPDTATVCVSDTGLGLTAGQIEVLFQPFRQVDMSDTRRYGGLGLSLALARKLAGQMGGQLSVESGGPQQGSTFTLTLARPLERGT